MDENRIPQDASSVIRRFFFSQKDRRLRLGWRLLVQTIFFLTLTFGFGILILIPIQQVWGKEPGGFSLVAISEGIEFLSITISVFISWIFLDRQPIQSLGLKVDRQMLPDLLAGFGMAMVMFGSIFLVMLHMGLVKISGTTWGTQKFVPFMVNFLMVTFAFLLVGWNEELLIRGYYLQTIASTSSMTGGILFSSLAFGLAHLLNPNASWASVLGITGTGFLLAFSYFRSRRLWLPMGIHFGWNFFEGLVFGLPVSGLKVFSLLQVKIPGPRVWTGGDFGPEAGLIQVAGWVLGLVLIYWYTRKQGSTLNR